MSAIEQVPAQGVESVVPRPGFIAEHGLWDSAQEEAAAHVLELVERQKLRRVRIGWGDQHGIVRGKTLTIPEFRRSLREGKDFQLVTAIFDTFDVCGHYSRPDVFETVVHRGRQRAAQFDDAPAAAGRAASPGATPVP